MKLKIKWLIAMHQPPIEFTKEKFAWGIGLAERTTVSSGSDCRLVVVYSSGSTGWNASDLNKHIYNDLTRQSFNQNVRTTNVVIMIISKISWFVKYVHLKEYSFKKLLHSKIFPLLTWEIFIVHFVFGIWYCHDTVYCIDRRQ